MKHVINWYVIDDCMSDRLTVWLTDRSPDDRLMRCDLLPPLLLPIDAARKQHTKRLARSQTLHGTPSSNAHATKWLHDGQVCAGYHEQQLSCSAIEQSSGNVCLDGGSCVQTMVNTNFHKTPPSALVQTLSATFVATFCLAPQQQDTFPAANSATKTEQCLLITWDD